MAAILVSGGTYSGSGDLTCDAVVLGGTNAADWGGTATFICPDGVLTLTDNSDVGYTDTAIFVRNGNSDTWTHNGGTVRFTGTGPQRVTDYYNAAWNWNNIEIQNNNTSLYEGVKWGSPWQSDTNVAGDLTLSGGAHYICDNKADKDFVVSGNVHLISGSFLRNAIPIDVGVGNAFGSLTIGANGTYAAAANGGEVLSITNETGAGYAIFNTAGGTFTHNDGTVHISMTGKNTLIHGMEGDDVSGTGANALNNLTVTLSTDNRVELDPADGGVSAHIIKGDVTIEEGHLKPDSTGHSLTIEGDVRIESGGTIGASNRTGDHSFGSLYIANGGTYEATPGTTTINSRTGGGYALQMQGTSAILNNNDGLFKFNSDDFVYVVMEGQSFHNVELDMDGSGGSKEFRMTANNGAFDCEGYLYMTDGTFKFNNTADTLTVDGLLKLTAGTFGYTGASPPTGAWSIGSLQIDGGTFEATAGTTTLNGTSGDLFECPGTFTHNSGSVKFDRSGLSQFWYVDEDITLYDLEINSNLVRSSGPTATLTVLNDITINASNSWKFTAGSAGRYLTGGDASHQCSFTNSGNFYVGSDGTGDVRIYGGDETKPLLFSVNDIVWEDETSGAGSIYLKWIDYDPDLDTVGDENNYVGITVEGDCEFDAVTIASGTNFTVASGQRVTFGDTLTINSHATAAYDGGKFIISGALVEMKGAAAWMEGGNQQYMGRDSASVIWNSTGIYSPNGGYLNYGWENVLWNASARVNQDSCFRNSNLIVAGGLSAQNRPIGTSARPSKIVVANGGTVSSSANVFHASTFSNRGGLFTSSSAFDFSVSGNIDCGTGASITNIFDGGGTAEAWIKIDGDAETASGMRPINKDSGWFISIDNATGDFYKLRLFYFWSGDNGVWSTTDAVFSKDKWHHFAITYNNSGYTNDPSMYIDGKLVQITEDSAPQLGQTRDSDATFKLYLGDRDDHARTFNGPIAMVRLFDDIRTGAEIRTDMFNQYSDMDDKTGLMGMWQFDEGQGGTVADVSTSGNTGTITFGDSDWSTAGTWTDGNKLGSETGVVAGNIYIGAGVNPTIFGTSYFTLSKRKLVSGSKFVSKAHVGTADYYIATSGTGDYLNYTKLSGAPIGVASEVKILADGSDRSYFSFDSTANNEQCHTLVNAGYVRIVNNSDFYTQDFDNSQGIWVRDSTYGGTIHDDGSTPHEYEPIDLIDDIDSFFDTEELID